MRGIGGNIKGILQVKSVTRNEIGEEVESWTDVQTLTGWLDLLTGSSGYSTFSTKVQESTHIFVGDYVPMDASVSAENARMVIKGKHYDVTLIDNPMEMESGSQWEIYLKYTGGQ